MNTNPTPEVGQVWADRDERTTYPEFEIMAFERRPIHRDVAGTSAMYAIVKRGGRRLPIRLDRLADTGSRGYRYIGRAK
jgi:hypothetical protein